jgi:hypothetical protein
MIKNPNIQSRRLEQMKPKNYTATAGERVNVTGDPRRVAQIVNGSLPTFSVVVPEADVEADPGNVTGIGAPQVFPFAVRVAPVIVLPSAEYVYESFGAQLLDCEIRFEAFLENSPD